MIWSKKNFWKSFNVAFSDEQQAYVIFIDDKMYHTQKGNILKITSASLARKVHNEWQKNTEGTKEFTRSNLALTNLIEQINDIDDEANALYLKEVIEYAKTDLLCYRSSSPKNLRILQEKKWDPIISFYEHEFSIKMLSTTSLEYINQDKDSLDKFHGILRAYDGPSLFLVYKMSQFLSSALLSVLLEKKLIGDEKAWRLSQLEEDWQKKIWGKDEEALKAEKSKKEAFKLVITCLRHLRKS